MKKFDSFCVQYDKPKVDVTCLIGKTIVEVDVSKDEFWIETSDGWVYLMYHGQDCCESVEIEDMDEDPNVLVGGFVVNAEEVEGVAEDTDWGSQTVTSLTLSNIVLFTKKEVRYYRVMKNLMSPS